MRNLNTLATILLLVCPAIAGETDYFPHGILAEKPQMSEFREQWYAKELKVLKEPSLWELSKTQQKAETYRFLWLRSFHPAISIRIDVNDDGSATVTIKSNNNKGRGKPEKLVKTKIRRLTDEQTQLFLDRVSDWGFWAQPTIEKTDVMGADGARWILEGVKSRKYLILDRWSPTAGPVRDLGTYMLFVIADLKLLYTEVY
jgi:hypothetical protein